MPEADKQLRQSSLISTIEDASRKTSWLRTVKSHQLKASGTSSTTLSDEQIERLSRYWLVDGSPTATTPVLRAVRDRGTFIVSRSFGFRGDNIRRILQSDLFFQAVNRNTGVQQRSFEALFVFANNSKTNKDGRVDQVAVLRHRNVLECLVFAVLLQLYATYEIRGKAAEVDFAPEFAEQYDDEPGASYGIYGRRRWYRHHLFFGERQDHPMTAGSACSHTFSICKLTRN